MRSRLVVNLRVIVESDKVTDGDSDKLSFEIAQKIQTEMTYPGQIKVTVIREKKSGQRSPLSLFPLWNDNNWLFLKVSRKSHFFLNLGKTLIPLPSLNFKLWTPQLHLYTNS